MAINMNQVSLDAHPASSRNSRVALPSHKKSTQPTLHKTALDQLTENKDQFQFQFVWHFGPFGPFRAVYSINKDQLTTFEAILDRGYMRYVCGDHRLTSEPGGRHSSLQHADKHLLQVR